MINVTNLYLGKDDKPLILELLDEASEPVNFADLTDVEVVLAINKVTVATYKASLTGALQIVPVDGEPTYCKLLITTAQQATWPVGLLQAQITLVSPDPDFDNQRRTTQIADLYYCKKSL